MELSLGTPTNIIDVNKDLYNAMSVGSWRFAIQYFSPNYINKETKLYENI